MTDAPGHVGIDGSGMKRPQRLSTNHQRDRDVIGATDTVEMVLDVAEHEADLVEIVEMVDYLQFRRRCFDRSILRRCMTSFQLRSCGSQT